MDEIDRLIVEKRYLVLHAPRQTGKTSCLLALMARLNAGADYTALYVNVEPAQAARGDMASGMRIILDTLAASADQYLTWRTGFYRRLPRSSWPPRPPAACFGKGHAAGADGSRGPWSCSWTKWIAWWETP